MILKKITIVALLLFCIQNIFADVDNKKLITAIENNNLKEVQLQIQDEKQANMLIDDVSVLCYAAFSGSDSIASYLIDKGADIMWDNGEDYSVLHAACDGCMSWLVKRIIKNSTKQVNMPKNNVYPCPLELAASTGCDSIVFQLLQTGKVANKVHAMEEAMMNKHLSTAQILIDFMSSKELKSNGAQLLTYSYKYPDTSAIELLVKNGIDININLSEDKSDNNTLFYRCLEGRKAEFASFCLRHDASYKHTLSYREYGSASQELPVLDYLFTDKYMGGYNSKEWMDVANLLIDIAAEKNELPFIMSDYKNLIEVALREKYTSVLFNLVYQGEKTSLTIKCDDGSEITPLLYIESFEGKDLSQDNIELEKEAQKIFDAIDSNDVKGFKKLFHAENYFNYNYNKRAIISNGKEQMADILEYAINAGNFNIVKYIISNELFGSISKDHYYLAVNSGHTDIFELLIEADRSFKSNGKWVLYEIDKPEFVEILLKNGVNADEYIFNGQSFLFYEFRWGNIENIDLFIKYSKKISDQYKALFTAIEQNDLKAIETIVKSGVDINQPVSGGLTPLCWAVYLGKLDAVELLINNKANVNVSWNQNEGYDPYPLYGSAPLRWAIEKNYPEIVKLLIEHKASPIINIFNMDGLNLFHLAAIQGNMEIMKMLINAYGNGNDEQDGNSSFESDIYSSYYDFNAVGIYNYRVVTPFDIAASNGNIELCNLFLEQGLGSDNLSKSEHNDYTPLYFAVSGKQIETVKFLVAKGANVNSKVENKIVKECTSNGTSDILKILIVNGALLTDEMLINAACHLDSDAVKSIVNTGGEQVNPGEVSFKLVQNILKNQNISNKAELVDYLIEHGLNINDQDKENKSVLQLAVEANNAELVRLLLSKGCELNPVANKNGNNSKRKPQNTLDMTTSFIIYKILKDNGAKSGGSV